MKIKRPLCVFALAVTAAVWLFLRLFPPDYGAGAGPDGEKVLLTGTVVQKETKRDFDGEEVPVIYLDLWDDRHVQIQCYLKADTSYIPSMGETIQIAGTCRNFKEATNPGEFDSRQYYSILKIAYQLREGEIKASDGDCNRYRERLYLLRCKFAAVLDSCLGESDASVMKAMLLGDKSELTTELKDLYRSSGIVHILSISGLHISMIGMGLFQLLRKCRMRVVPACLIAIFVMWSYGIMTGMSTSAFRAITMFIIRLGALLLGRTYDMLTGLSVACLLLLFDQPLYVYHAGFLMSFGAIIGVAIVLPAVSPIRKNALQQEAVGEQTTKEKIMRRGTEFAELLKQTALCSISISIVTFPVYTSYYHSFPVYSLLLNLIILNLMTFVMGSGLLCMGLGMIRVILGIPPGYVVHYLLALYERCCRVNQKLPGSTWYVGHSSLWQTVLYLLCLVFFLRYTKEIRRRMDLLRLENRDPKALESRECRARRLRRLHSLRFGFLLLGAYILVLRIKPPLKLTFLDVGQGNGFVLQYGGSNYLVDGGSTSKSSVGKYQLQPYLAYEGIGYLDFVMISHEDADHISGIMELMENSDVGGTRIGNLILPDVAESSKGDNYLELVALAGEKNIPVSYIKRGDEIRCSGQRRLLQITGAAPELVITCLGPVEGMVTEQANAYSTVLHLRCGAFSAMLTGDVEEDGLTFLKEYMRARDDLFPDDGNTTLISVPHHGSRYTTDEEFLSLCRPAVCIISCGRNNRYGHPHEELLWRLSDIGAQVEQTQYSGAVTVTTDGTMLQLERFLEEK